MSFDGRNILITGGAGFIGSALARYLVKAGARVTLVDSMIPEYGGNLQNISDIEGEVELSITDVRDRHAMAYLVRGKHYLFNLAGQTSHMDSMKDPETDLEINARAQLSILETCRDINPELRIVFASTRQLYGKPHYLPVDEKHPIRPVDVNGVNKHAGESFHLLYHDVYRIPVSVLRLTNTYGPGMRVKDARQTFLGIWLKHTVEQSPFEVWGGEQLRDFNYVDDVVDALVLAALDDAAIGGVYNLGSDEVVSLLQVADMLREQHGAKFEVKQFPDDRKKIDIGDYYSDFSKIQAELGWQPRVQLKQGLATTLAYYQQNLQAYL